MQNEKKITDIIDKYFKCLGENYSTHVTIEDMRLIIIGDPHGSVIFECVKEFVENIEPEHMLIEHPVLLESLEDIFKYITFDMCDMDTKEKILYQEFDDQFFRTEREKKMGEKIINSFKKNYKLIIAIVGHSHAMENSHIHNMLKKEKIEYITIWKDGNYCKRCNFKIEEKDSCPECGTKKDKYLKMREYKRDIVKNIDEEFNNT